MNLCTKGSICIIIMQLFESACRVCRRVRSPVYSCTTEESIDKFIGLVEARVDCGRSIDECVQQKRGSGRIGLQ